MCKKRLQVRHEGWVCKNCKCDLYHKLGKGWVFYDKHSMLVKKNNIHALLFHSGSRLFEQKQFALLKQNVMLRDKYLCQNCGVNRGLCVHHIIPVSEDANLSLEKDNMVTLCNKCHNLVHSCDKRRFG